MTARPPFKANSSPLFEPLQPGARPITKVIVKADKMPKQMNDDFLNCLDVDNLLKLASWHDDMSRRLKLRANEIKNQDERRDKNKARIEQWNAEKIQLVRLMEVQMQDGKNFLEATSFVSQKMAVNAKTCETLFKRFVTTKKKDARKARKILVSKYALAGWTNDQIALELGVHRNTVSKDINEALKARISRV